MTAGTATASPATALAEWSSYIAHARNKRLDPDQFAADVEARLSKHPLPPVLVADLLLRPTEFNDYALDPRMPRYLQVLQKQGRVDTAAVLTALYRYTSVHARVQQPQDGALSDGADGKEKEGGGAGAGAGKGKGKGKGKGQKVVRWRNSYPSDEILFWRLAQAVNQGSGIRTSDEAIAVARVLVKWMALFADAAAAFSRATFGGSMHGLQARDETEDSRNAFALLFLAFTENQTVLFTLSRPACKG